MRKRSAIVVSILAAVLLVTSCLVGCGKKGEAVDYAGRYTLSGATIEGSNVGAEEVALNYPADENYIEIIDSINIIVVIKAIKTETTYTKEGNILHVADGNGVIDFYLENGELIYAEDGDEYRLVFTKS